MLQVEKLQNFKEALKSELKLPLNHYDQCTVRMTLSANELTIYTENNYKTVIAVELTEDH